MFFMFFLFLFFSMTAQSLSASSKMAADTPGGSGRGGLQLGGGLASRLCVQLVVLTPLRGLTPKNKRVGDGGRPTR